MEKSPISDAQLRAIRESLGMPIRELARVSGIKEESVSAMEHGNLPISNDLEAKLNRIEQVTEEYIVRLARESRNRGFIETYRFTAEMAARVPELSHFGSMWHRSCALQVQDDTGLPIQYPPRPQRLVI